MDSGGGFEADSLYQHTEVINNALVKAIDLRPALLLQLAIAWNGAKQSGGKRSVDALEEFEEDERDRVAAWQQAVSAQCGSFSTSFLALSLDRS